MERLLRLFVSCMQGGWMAGSWLTLSDNQVLEDGFCGEGALHLSPSFPLPRGWNDGCHGYQRKAGLALSLCHSNLRLGPETDDRILTARGSEITDAPMTDTNQYSPPNKSQSDLPKQSHFSFCVKKGLKLPCTFLPGSFFFLCSSLLHVCFSTTWGREAHDQISLE